MITIEMEVRAVWTWRLLLRRTVVINQHDRAFRGLLYRRRGPLVELRNAVLYEPGMEPKPVDGAVILERSTVTFWQVVDA